MCGDGNEVAGDGRKKVMARGIEALHLALGPKREHYVPEVYDARRCSPHRQ